MIPQQTYIPTMEEADLFGRHGPNKGGGTSVHASGIPAPTRQYMENVRKRQSKAKAKASSSGV
eukprot:12386795-Prorocentrum_lima.AAC.1